MSFSNWLERNLNRSSKYFPQSLVTPGPHPTCPPPLVPLALVLLSVRLMWWPLWFVRSISQTTARPTPRRPKGSLLCNEEPLHVPQLLQWCAPSRVDVPWWAQWYGRVGAWKGEGCTSNFCYGDPDCDGWEFLLLCWLKNFHRFVDCSWFVSTSDPCLFIAKVRQSNRAASRNSLAPPWGRLQSGLDEFAQWYCR